MGGSNNSLIEDILKSDSLDWKRYESVSVDDEIRILKKLSISAPFAVKSLQILTKLRDLWKQDSGREAKVAENLKSYENVVNLFVEILIGFLANDERPSQEKEFYDRFIRSDEFKGIYSILSDMSQVMTYERRKSVTSDTHPLADFFEMISRSTLSAFKYSSIDFFYTTLHAVFAKPSKGAVKSMEKNFAHFYKIDFEAPEASYLVKYISTQFVNIPLMSKQSLTKCFMRLLTLGPIVHASIKSVLRINFTSFKKDFAIIARLYLGAWDLCKSRDVEGPRVPVPERVAAYLYEDLEDLFHSGVRGRIAEMKLVRAFFQALLQEFEQQSADESPSAIHSLAILSRLYNSSIEEFLDAKNSQVRLQAAMFFQDALRMLVTPPESISSPADAPIAVDGPLQKKSKKQKTDAPALAPEERLRAQQRNIAFLEDRMRKLAKDAVPSVRLQAVDLLSIVLKEGGDYFQSGKVLAHFLELSRDAVPAVSSAALLALAQIWEDAHQAPVDGTVPPPGAAPRGRKQGGKQPLISDRTILSQRMRMELCKQMDAQEVQQSLLLLFVQCSSPAGEIAHAAVQLVHAMLKSATFDETKQIIVQSALPHLVASPFKPSEDVLQLLEVHFTHTLESPSGAVQSRGQKVLRRLEGKELYSHILHLLDEMERATLYFLAAWCALQTHKRSKITQINCLRAISASLPPLIEGQAYHLECWNAVLARLRAMSVLTAGVLEKAGETETTHVVATLSVESLRWIVKSAEKALSSSGSAALAVMSPRYGIPMQDVLQAVLVLCSKLQLHHPLSSSDALDLTLRIAITPLADAIASREDSRLGSAALSPGLQAQVQTLVRRGEDALLLALCVRSLSLFVHAVEHLLQSNGPFGIDSFSEPRLLSDFGGLEALRDAETAALYPYDTRIDQEPRLSEIVLPAPLAVLLLQLLLLQRSASTVPTQPDCKEVLTSLRTAYTLLMTTIANLIPLMSASFTFAKVLLLDYVGTGASDDSMALTLANFERSSVPMVAALGGLLPLLVKVYQDVFFAQVRLSTREGLVKDLTTSGSDQPEQLMGFAPETLLEFSDELNEAADFVRGLLLHLLMALDEELQQEAQVLDEYPLASSVQHALRRFIALLEPQVLEVFAILVEMVCSGARLGLIPEDGAMLLLKSLLNPDEYKNVSVVRKKRQENPEEVAEALLRDLDVYEKVTIFLQTKVPEPYTRLLGVLVHLSCRNVCTPVLEAGPTSESFLVHLVPLKLSDTDVRMVMRTLAHQLQWSQPREKKALVIQQFYKKAAADIADSLATAYERGFSWPLQELLGIIFRRLCDAAPTSDFAQKYLISVRKNFSFTPDTVSLAEHMPLLLCLFSGYLTASKKGEDEREPGGLAHRFKNKSLEVLSNIAQEHIKKDRPEDISEIYRATTVVVLGLLRAALGVKKPVHFREFN